MRESLRYLFIVAAHIIGECSPSSDHCDGCSLAYIDGSDQSVSLLQARRGVEHKSHGRMNSTSKVVVARSQGNASGVECIPGHGCASHKVPSGRAMCVARETSRNECWDVCNMSHQLEDFQTGNVMLDIEVQDTVRSIRDGRSSSISCQSASGQQLQEEDRVEATSQKAPLDEAGYKQVAALGSRAAMESYIRRVVKSIGCRIADESKLQGVVPFYSGETAVQSYAALETETFRACTQTGTWLSSLYPSRIPSTPATSSLGTTAPLNEQGFQEVAQAKDDLAMLRYTRRIISMLHGWVVDESGLHGLLPFFDGEKGKQTLGELILEVQKTMQRPDGWVMKAPDSMRRITGEVRQPGSNTSEDDEMVPATPLDMEEEVEERLEKIASQTSANAERSFKDCPDDDQEELNALNQTAWAVPLDDEGYDAIAQLKNDCAMFQFAVRVVQDIHCRVLDESGLKGLVPFYSGTQVTQDLHELRVELEGACSMEGKWLVPDVKYWAEEGKVEDASTDQAAAKEAGETSDPAIGQQ